MRNDESRGNPVFFKKKIIKLSFLTRQFKDVSHGVLTNYNFEIETPTFLVVFYLKKNLGKGDEN